MFSIIPWRKERPTDTALLPGEGNPFALMRREFDSLFDRFLGNWPGLAEGASGWSPDVEDTGKEVVVRVPAPGFEATDFDVQVTGDVLQVRAEHTAKGEGKTSRFGRVERWLSLPPGMDVEKVEAHYRNGVLEVHLPRMPGAQGRRVEVKT